MTKRPNPIVTSQNVIDLFRSHYVGESRVCVCVLPALLINMSCRDGVESLFVGERVAIKLNNIFWKEQVINQSFNRYKWKISGACEV